MEIDLCWLGAAIASSPQLQLPFFLLFLVVATIGNLGAAGLNSGTIASVANRCTARLALKMVVLGHAAVGMWVMLPAFGGYG